MIRVIIERHIAESLEEPYQERARNVLQKAIHAAGFISGEALKDMHHPNTRIILSSWRSTTDWQRWYASEDRKAVMAELMPMLEGPEKISVLELA